MARLLNGSMAKIAQGVEALRKQQKSGELSGPAADMKIKAGRVTPHSGGVLPRLYGDARIPSILSRSDEYLLPRNHPLSQRQIAIGGNPPFLNVSYNGIEYSFDRLDYTDEVVVRGVMRHEGRDLVFTRKYDRWRLEELGKDARALCETLDADMRPRFELAIRRDLHIDNLAEDAEIDKVIALQREQREAAQIEAQAAAEADRAALESRPEYGLF